MEELKRRWVADPEVTNPETHAILHRNQIHQEALMRAGLRIRDAARAVWGEPPPDDPFGLFPGPNTPGL